MWAQSCLGTNLCGHKRVWAQSCVGINVCGHKVSGHNRVGSSMYGHKRVVSVTGTTGIPAATLLMCLK